MRYMTRMLHNTAMLGFQLQPSIYLSIYQAMGDAPRDLVSLDFLEGNVFPLHRLRLALALDPARQADGRHVSLLKMQGIDLADEAEEIDAEVDEITRKSLATIALCDLATSETQQVQPEIGACLTRDASRAHRSSPPARATRIKGVHMQEDYFGVFPLTRSDTRMEPSNLLMPASAGGPPRPSHWPAPRSK